MPCLGRKYNEINKKLMKVTVQGNQHEKKGKGFGNGVEQKEREINGKRMESKWKMKGGTMGKWTLRKTGDLQANPREQHVS
jgi:hypothetical protein